MTGRQWAGSGQAVGRQWAGSGKSRRGTPETVYISMDTEIGI